MEIFDTSNTSLFEFILLERPEIVWVNPKDLDDYKITFDSYETFEGYVWLGSFKYFFQDLDNLENFSYIFSKVDYSKFTLTGYLQGHKYNINAIYDLYCSYGLDRDFQFLLDYEYEKILDYEMEIKTEFYLENLKAEFSE